MAVTKRATVFWRVPLLVAFLAVFLSAVLVSGEGSGSEPPTDDGEDSFKTSSAPTPMAFTTGSSPPTAVTPASLTSAFATVNETKPTDGAKDNGTNPISFTQTSTAPTSTAFTTGSDVHSTNLHTGSAPTPASMTSADKSTDVTKASILPTPTGFSTGTPGQTTELSTSNTAAVVTSGFATGSETEPTDVFKTNTIPTDTEFVTGSQTQPTTPPTGTAPTPASPGTLAPPPPPTSLPYCPKMQYHNGTACVSCECASAGTDYCDEAKGVCSCLEGYFGKSCQECEVPAGYLPSSNQTCQFCPKCSVNGTATCTETAGMGSSKIVTCQCRSNWEGATCNTCSNLTYRGISHSNDTSFASVDCLPCLCDPKGAASCNVANGDCTCRPGYTGGECQRCASFYYPNKAQHCVKCNCTTHGTLSCQQDTGTCHCAAGFQGADCSQCSQQYHRSMDGRCQPCNCSWSGSVGCNSTTGQCLCSSGWTGKQCETCPQFYFISRNTNISGNATGLSNCTASSLGDCNAANFDHMMNVTDLLPPLVCNDSIAECNFTATGLVANGLQCTACQCHRAGSIGCAPLTGVCLCMPGFAGPRCDRCLDFHYHSTNASVCERCNCPSSGSVSCNATSGQCNCRPNHHGERCTNCTNRHYLNDHGFCVACNCSIDGSVGCDPLSGSCSCGPNWSGPHCDICPHLHYTTSNKSVSVPMSGTGTLVNMTMHALNCVPCACHQNGSAGCDRWNGSCHCHTSVTGSDCSVCAMGHFQNSTLPHCDRCDCHRNGSVGCDQRNGNCICRNQTTGSKCDMCKPWFYSPLPHILDCQPCNCSTPGSAFCNRTTGQCGCHRTWTGKRCDQCPHLHYLGTVNKGDDPSCIPCDCSADGTLSCSDNGQCHCRTNVSGDRCDRCAAGNYRTNNSLSSCTDCGCNPNGASGCDWLTGQCNCTSGYIGHQCSSCRHWHFLSSSANPPVCSPCACDTVGSASCSNLTGSCTCRPYIAGALCDRCSTPGTKVQSLENCDDCQCVSNGTQSCNMKTGVCMCRPHVSGLYCGQCSAFAFTTSSLDSCQACSCDKGKSLSCGNTTGTCACRPGAVGAHCSSCAAGYYSNSSGPCQQCDCHPVGAVSCNNDTGTCICQPNVDGSHCDRCTHLYYPAPNANKAQALAQCTPCMCDPVGSLSCNASGTCKCHHNVVGSSCDRCAPFHFRNITLTHCSPCNCDQSGSSSCTEETGLCNCRPHATGDRCQTCVQGYYKNSKTGLCVPCTCDALASTSCDPETGNCMCRQDAAGKNCSACSPSYYRPSKLQTCQRCACNTDGTQFCDGLTGKCICKANITGVLCDRCALFFYRAGGSVANCSLCQCHQAGSLSCNEQSGACKCRPSVVGTHCDRCQSFHYQLPSLENCVSCSCFPAGTVSCNQTNGVCNCRDNVNGTTCNQCDSGYFAMPTVASCSKCLCNAVGTQRCDPRNGKCHCRSNVAGSQCSSCAPGYFQNTTLDNCVRCQCDPSGSLGCNQESGECICRPNVGGSRCDSCIALSYPNPSIARCKPCLCHPIGSSSCNATGHCVCRPNVTGSFCHSCAPGYYSNPTLAQCTVCACHSSRTKRCNPGTGQCACIPNAQGSTCSSCRAGFYYNNVTRSCVSCSCNPLGTASCNSVTGECVCHSNVAGSSCSVCAKGYHRQGQLPNCVKCACNVNGTDICNPFTGACQCKANVLGPVCDSCPRNFYMPSGPGSCRECACNLLGTAQCAGSKGTCQCISNVIGANCTQCRVNYFQKPSLLNCAPCLCEPTGTESCNRVTGTCTCKTDVAGLRCNRCKAKFFRNPTLANCTACGCNVQGSNRVQCDESSGQCTCRAGVTDRTCNRCQEGYFWPNSSLSCCGSCTTTPGTPCQACRCSAGAVNQSCNATGQCLCRDGHSGLKCNQCAKQSWIFLEESGCADPSNVFYPFGPNVTDQEMSSSSNGSQVKFRVLNLPFGIPIGTTLFRYPSVGISSAGYLTFSRPAPFNPPMSFPEGQPIISPYWSITDLRCRGRVYYQIHTSGSVVDRANSDVRALGNATDSSFSARWVLVVTWVDVHAFPDRGNAPALGANSFQAVVTTDGCVSYSMFHYLNGSIVWSGRFNIHARMGYTDGSGVYTYSHPDSSTPAVKTVDLSSNINATYNGKWMWRITGPCSGTFLAQRKCLKWADDDAILYPEVGDYSEAAQPCPPSFRQAISDQQFTFFRNYKEQRFCVRQRFSSRFSGKQIYSICCYDRKFQGALNIGPPNGGFVTFPNHPHSVAFEMGDEDKRQLCCEQAFICDVFYMRRPSDTGSRYVPPRWTWVFGDPHFRSLDGKSYTFNGWGEYMCFEGDLNMEKVQVNCRTGRLSNPSSTATVFTAFAMGVRNSTGYIQQRLQIEYSNVSNPLTLNVDGADMTSNVTSLMNASQSVSFGHFDVSHDNYSLLSVVFSTGVVVNVSVTAPYILTMSMAVPMTYYDNTRGLQGYFNGNPSDDFKLRNGTVLQANSSERALLPFGQDWQVNSSESLFMYSNGKTYLNYTHPDHVPVFSDEVNASAFPADVRAACGNNTICLYDALESGDVTLGQASQSTTSNLASSENTATNNPPSTAGNGTVYVTGGMTNHFSFTATDSNNFSISLNGTLPSSSEYNLTTLSSGNTTQVNFYWKPSNHSAVTLRFEATDIEGATSTFLPNIVFCGCQNGGTCLPIDMAEVDFGDDSFLLQECSCPDAYSGNRCEADADGCKEVSCYMGVECTDVPAPGTGANCSDCPAGLTGDGSTCQDLDECTSGTHNCNAAASCTNTDGNYTCQCMTGYSGSGYSCSDVDECMDGHDCHAAANCNNTIGTFACACLLGYSGDGSLECEDINECILDSDDCHTDATCFNHLNGTYSCACSSGYTGNGTSCPDLDECATMTHDCSMLAVCTNTDGSYNCACNSGYTGNGTSCIDVDECMSSPCHTNATCVNNPRSYSCACLPGYTGSGVLCQDVNECELPNTCGPNAHCLNTPGSRSCICNSGYAGDGIQCADVDECKIGTDACHELSHCQNTIGHYKCSCQPGFVGTGLMCRESILFPYGPSQGDRRLVLSSADACSEPFVTPFPVKFGSSTHFKFFICENGLISLSNPFHNFKPEVFPGAQTSNVRNSHIAAPFWSDIDLTRGGNIYYQVYSADSNSAEYSEVLEGVQNLTGLDSFVPLGMFVVTWDEVYTTGNDLNPPNNTFQAVLLADDITSVAIFLFEPNRLNWGQSGNLYAVSGIYTGSDLYKNHPYSGTANIVRLGDTADSAGRQGIYVYIGSSETNITGQTSPFGACQTFVRMDEAALGLVTSLGNDSLVCPCSLNQVSLDFRWSNVAANNTHSCFMPLFTSQFEAVKNCCYSLGGSSGLGALLVGQLYRYDPRAVPSLHNTYDAEPFRQCCLLSVLCANFSSRRPDDTCAGYAPPLLTLAWGDPHLKTLDGKFYTFNGRGEYILLETIGGTFSLQGRTTLFNGTTATTFSAVAMKQFTGMASPTVEVQLTSNNTLAVLVDGNAIGPGPYSNVSFAWPNNDTSSARIVFGTGLVVTVEERMGTMAVVTSTPMSFSGNTRGLYGVWNNDPADDFTLPNNTVLHVNSSERTLFDFGQEWQVTSSQSLFTYGAGLSVLTYSFPDHMPIFSDEIPASNYSDLQTVCSGNPSCLFDALVSGNVALGLASMNTENTVLNDSNTLQNFPPAFHGSVLFAAELNVQATYTVTVNDTDNFTVTAQGLPAGSYTLTLLNGLVTLLWTPTSTDAVTVVLSATDTASASTHLNLMTVLCACQNGANCLPVTSTSSPFSTNACNCSAAYTGSFCEADLDGCATQGCATGVVCTDNVAPMTGYTCGDCPAGLTGDGVRCLDINECNTSTHGCAQTCVNSYASYTCSCAVGYTLAMNGRDCTNVNECGGGSGPCHQVCQDTEGSYNCSCNPGFTLFAGNNQSCNASVNCPPGHGCEHDCAVVNSVNVCSCNQGYVLVQPGNTNCNDVNECAGAGTCSQNCTNTPGSYSCSCFSGFNLDTDGISCIDIDECLNPSICNVSGSLCHNTVGGYTCNCTDGTHNVGGICQALPQIILPPNQPTTMATTVMTTISATTTVPPATTASNIQSGVTANFLNLTTAQVASQQSIMLAIIRNTTIQLCRTNLTCFGGNTTAIENIQVTFHRVAAASVGGTTLVVVVEAFGSALPSSLLTNVLGSALLASMLQNAGLGQVSVVQTGAQEESSSSNLGAILGGAIGGVGVLGVMVGAAVKYKMSSGGANITRQRARFSFRKKRSPWDTSVDGTSGKTRRQPSMKWARQASDLFMKPNAVATAADLEAVEMGQSGQVKESSLVADTAAEPRYAGNAAPNTAAEAAAPVYETASDDTTAPGRQHQTSVSFVNKPAALNL
eukprot:scpid1187/ scgid4064/ Laminin subunit alpha-5; Laminin-10 subunit alpha; Laminin-11 subunit alpha; Laminin-15 subunit alpha